MKKLLYKFLDEYVGNGVRAVKEHIIFNPYTFMPDERVKRYNLISDRNILILFFQVWDDENKIKIYRGNKLCDTLSGYFGISSDNSMNYVRDWFADKHDMKKVSDLLKFIPDPVDS
jgi:hypothetical protein